MFLQKQIDTVTPKEPKPEEAAEDDDPCPICLEEITDK